MAASQQPLAPTDKRCTLLFSPHMNLRALNQYNSLGKFSDDCRPDEMVDE